MILGPYLDEDALPWWHNSLQDILKLYGLIPIDPFTKTVWISQT